MELPLLLTELTRPLTSFLATVHGDRRFALVLLAIAGFFVVVAWGIVIWVFFRISRGRCTQARLAAGLSLRAGESVHPVWVSRPAFISFWRLWPVEGAGVLVHGPGGVRVLAETWAGGRLERAFPGLPVVVRWRPRGWSSAFRKIWMTLGPTGQELLVCAADSLGTPRAFQANRPLYELLATGRPIPPRAQGPGEYALDRHPRAQWVVVAFFALLAYGLIDGYFTNPLDLLNRRALIGPAAGVLVLGLGLGLWMAQGLTRSGVPRADARGLALMWVLALVGAGLPALKRLDAALAGQPVTITYRLEGGGRLHAVVPDGVMPDGVMPDGVVPDGAVLGSAPPPLNYSRVAEYWAQFAEGSEHEFSLWHGPLGLWQLDNTALWAKTRAFYDK